MIDPANKLVEAGSSSTSSFIIGVCAAVIIALSAPLSYFLVQFERLSANASASAAHKAQELSEMATNHSATWQFSERKLKAILEKQTESDQAEVSYLTDTQGNELSRAGARLAKPVITAEATIYDAGAPVGHLYISRSLNQALWHSGFLLLLGLIVSSISYFFLRILPLRRLKQAYLQLENAHNAISEEKERIQVTLQSIGDAVITTDAQMHVEYLNPIAESLTGWTTAEAKGLHMDTVFKIYNEVTREAAVNPIRECLDSNRIVEMENHTILVRRHDNEEFHIEDSAAPIRRPDGSIVGAVMVFHDVTERKMAQNRLHHIAFHDALTGLPNRALFQKRLAKAITDARFLNKRVAVLFMDLDKFKAINDSLGHGIGDELLILVAKRLEQCIRDSDTVSRMGGDEFTAVLSGIGTPENAAAVATKIIDSITKPFNIQGHTFRISTSIGITIYPDDGDDVDILLKNADTAMYHAKDQGRNNFQYYAPSMNATAASQLHLDNALYAALEKNEYLLEYQPKLSLHTNTIVGAEALLRWHSPELGRVMPADFIPKLEESGEIVKVGNWVLKTAVMQAKQWLDAGHPLVMSVNVSSRQFKQNGLVDYIASLLKTVGLPARLLQIELTESILMEDASRNELLMLELIGIGVNVALDDFGTGYSSLSYLRRFPINELKIDRSFVMDMSTNETAEKIVKTVIDLGQALGMKVTAEGVETQKQCAQLRALGCNEIQGYFLSRPLGNVAMEDLLQTYASKRDLFVTET